MILKVYLEILFTKKSRRRRNYWMKNKSDKNQLFILIFLEKHVHKIILIEQKNLEK